ncbi:programmed cell death 6-interacting protein [Daktulosphaira vitifoliae]|uniref:programmed cell death 6-interacting protein n=1 Tax=Daktulosphaira vitifoliae TaxID=58002 RepID=UPI0021AA314E|nr:programmed cell death 6-interacting protein [Daktulosphaira vitifoliae]
MSTNTYLLSVPVKRASDVNIVKPLKNLISSHYNSSDNPEDYTEAINELSKLRNQALWKVLDKYDNSLELIYSYYDQITALEAKVPPTEVQIPFKWKDAFNKMTSFFANGKVNLTLSSIGYEKVCVLFNIAAQQSAVAATQNFESDEGLKLAAKYLQQSAGIFNTLKTTVMSVIQQDPTPDLNPDMLAMLSTLMLAQAQEMFVLKANIDKMKDQSIAKLCSQCEEYYCETVKLMEKESVLMSLDKEWTSCILAKQAIFQGLTQFHQSMVCKNNKSIGEQIARLNEAINYLKLGQSRCGRSIYQGQYNKAQQELAEAKKDNDFIYHERIPEVKNLEPVAKATIAKPTPVPSKLSSKFKDLFENLVPVSVQQALSTYDVRKTELVNTEIGKLREATQILNGCLASLNLPAALEDVKGVGIPQSLIEKSNSVRMNGGIQKLETLIRELPELLKRNEEIINESERMLNEEQESDDQLQAQFKEKWNRTKSSTLTQVFRVNITKYREIIKNATSADKMIREKFDSQKRAIHLLSEGQEAIQSVLPAASNSGVNFANSTAADKLRHLMEEVEIMKNERDVIETELKCASTDMKSKFLNALAEEGTINEGNLSTESLDQSYAHLQIQVRDSLIRQETLLSHIQVVNTEFCKEKSSGGQREALFKDLAAGYDVFNELQNNLMEGTKFYNDLTEILITAQNKISDFCFARKAEKEELLKSLTKNLSQETPVTVPPSNQTFQTGTAPLNLSSSIASQQLPYPMQPQGMPLPYTLPRTGPYPGYMPPMPTAYNPYATLPYPQQNYQNYPSQSQQLQYPQYPQYPPQNPQQPPAQW